MIVTEFQGFHFLKVVRGNVQKITIQTEDYDFLLEPDYNFRLEYNHHTKKYLTEVYTTKTFTGEGDFFEYDFLGQVDLDRKELVKTYGEYPYPHKKKPLGYDFCPSVVYPGDSVIVAFGALNYVTVYDQSSGKALRNYCIESEFESMVYPPFDSEWDIQKQRNYWTENGHFLNFYYDKYRNLFYRLVCHSQPLKNDQGELNNFFDGNWSIIFIDSDLHVISEQKFDAKQYNPYEVIITKKGVYISNVKKNTEDAVAWDLFEVETT